LLGRHPISAFGCPSTQYPVSTARLIEQLVYHFRFPNYFDVLAGFEHTPQTLAEQTVVIR